MARCTYIWSKGSLLSCPHPHTPLLIWALALFRDFGIKKHGLQRWCVREMIVAKLYRRIGDLIWSQSSSLILACVIIFRCHLILFGSGADLLMSFYLSPRSLYSKILFNVPLTAVLIVSWRDYLTGCRRELEPLWAPEENRKTQWSGRAAG